MYLREAILKTMSHVQMHRNEVLKHPVLAHHQPHKYQVRIPYINWDGDVSLIVQFDIVSSIVLCVVMIVADYYRLLYFVYY